MLKFNDLLFNKWILSTLAALKEPNPGPYEINPYKLPAKLWKTRFYEFFDVNVITSYSYWLKTDGFFANFPRTCHPRYFERFLETTPKELRVNNDADLEPIKDVVLRAFVETLDVWLDLPVFLIDLFKYYPYYKPTTLHFDETELGYLDCWIQILPVFQDFLGHLLVNDTPLVAEDLPETFLGMPRIKAPQEKDINFSEHIREYYFGEGSIPEFKDVINLYLDNRLELKTKCVNSFNVDKQLNNQIPDDLAVYFISHFLIKGISKYTLRFVVANLNLSIKNPIKRYRDADVKKWNAYSEEEKRAYWPEGWLAEQKK